MRDYDDFVEIDSSDFLHFISRRSRIIKWSWTLASSVLSSSPASSRYETSSFLYQFLQNRSPRFDVLVFVISNMFWSIYYVPSVGWDSQEFKCDIHDVVDTSSHIVIRLFSPVTDPRLSISFEHRGHTRPCLRVKVRVRNTDNSVIASYWRSSSLRITRLSIIWYRYHYRYTEKRLLKMSRNWFECIHDDIVMCSLDQDIDGKSSLIQFLRIEILFGERN